MCDLLLLGGRSLFCLYCLGLFFCMGFDEAIIFVDSYLSINKNNLLTPKKFALIKIVRLIESTKPLKR